MCCSTCRRDAEYGELSAAATAMRCSPARGSRWRRTSATRPISSCGSRAREGVIGWDSPWGRGRPGWHIECSAMIARASWRDHRHPRRRARPHLPAPRERDRPEPLRPRRRAAGAILGAQRLRRHGRREDVEVARQYRHAGGAAGAGHRGETAAAGVAVGALPPAAGVDRGGGRASEGDARPALSGGRRWRAGRSRRRSCRGACATTSTRRSRCRGWRRWRIRRRCAPAAQLIGPVGRARTEQWFRGEGDARSRGADRRTAPRPRRARDFADGGPHSRRAQGRGHRA